ncbi:heme biosynthesis HemY N-terminal domain-containing protein [Psychromonas aquimarina]|uniref:heme biosynthesis HemY N-terminal domain-containing protein n=1 Tax=Psychromonas aquimarina TaxID=444919 RepID=UPI0004163DFF|nr:heme biosynthesis HemY N-terminal domain-containing protein [Psychromonas aquimarina]
MIRIIIIVAVLMAGLIFAPEISGNKGYILVSLDTYTTYETTIINAVFMAVIFYFLLLLAEWLLRKLLSMSSVTRGWFGQRKTKKAQKNSLLGMLALFEGDAKQAQKLLAKSAERTEAPALTYIAAARAAQQQGQYDLRDEYLQQATQSQQGCRVAVALVWVELQLEAKQYENALATLNELDTNFPKKKRAVELYLQIYPALQEWQKYIDVLHKQRKSLDYTESEFEAVQLDAYQHLFTQLALQEGAALHSYWENTCPRWMRKELAYQKILLDALINSGNDKIAEQLLLEKLNKQFSLPLVPYIDKLTINDHYPLIQLLEKKLKKESETGLIHQALAKLKLKENNYAAVIQHLIISVESVADIDDFVLLADLLEKDDREQEAQNYYRKGLLSAVS